MKMKKLIFYHIGYSFVFLILFVLISCKENKTLSLYKDMINKKIHIIDSFPIRIGENFLNETEKKEIFLKNIKMIIIINGYCEFCFTQIEEWKDFILTLKLLDSSKITFLFYVYSLNYLPFNSYISTINFEYPIVYDTNNFFAKLNNIPDDNILNTMLVFNDTIRLSGNPILIPKMKKLYINYFKEIINNPDFKK